ncbi:MAG: proprotein convertase P-domain-containing protein [Acidobacteriota bacterium]|jgi:subtilisin-like proprotein convertase family protein
MPDLPIRPTRALRLAALLLLLLPLLTLAGEPSTPRSARLQGLTPIGQVAAWLSPPVDVPALRAEDEANRDLPGIPLRIGFPMATDLNPGNSGTWEELPDGGRLWRLRVGTEGALWIVLGFDQFKPQPGAELWVYPPLGQDPMGPFTAADIRSHGELWFPPIAGDELVVELYWPAALRGEKPEVHLGTVSHGYEPFGVIGRTETEAVDDSGACNIDVACPLGDNWQDQKRGVVVALSGGFAFCSASLINTTADDCRPYVLTANHCSVGPSTTYGFNFEKPACGSGTPPPATNQTVTGSVVRASYASSDFTLVELDSQVPEEFGPYYSGWSRNPAAAPECWTIHHPSGDVKKISHNADPLIDGINYGTNHWRITEWEEGTTEPGSSGSPLFDPDQRIIGQLHGGLASCTVLDWDEYGKLDASWTGGGTPSSRLQDWLDPEGTGALAVDGVDLQSCLFQPAGSVSVDASVYACDSTVTISLRDDSLQGLPSQDVEISSGSESAPETVTLLAAGPDSGVFVGVIPLDAGPVAPGNGSLTVADGDMILVEYLDADDGQGGTNLLRQATAPVDCLGPAIANVGVTDVTGTSAVVGWETSEPADSLVTYGSAPPGDTGAGSPGLVTAHAVPIGGLGPCSLYFFSVASQDAAGNLGYDDNGGALYSFSTGSDNQPAFASADTPVAIPDDDPGGATSTITVAETDTVLDVDVLVNIAHTYDGDLSLYLDVPGGGSILLSNRRGGGGNDFIDTRFDDDAAADIASGSAPFTGSFRPDESLDAANGIAAAGDWSLRVVDQAGQDTGSIESWSLILTLPSIPCGPSARYGSHGLEDDACAAGGAGSGDGWWDPGEAVAFDLVVQNDGIGTLNDVSVTVTPTAGGIAMLDAVAAVGSIEAGASGISGAVTASLDPGAACGQMLGFDVRIDAAEGSWSSSFQQPLGLVVPGGGVAFAEDFETGDIPLSWTVVDGFGDGATWYADDAGDPGGCGNTDPNPPIGGTWAAIDSDCADLAMNEELISPVIDLTAATAATLEFDHWFRWYSGGQSEIGDVDIRSSLTGGAWVNLASWTGDTANPAHEAIDITALAAGAADVQLRWHYYQAKFEWTWFVDNIVVSYDAPGDCFMNACEAGPFPAPPGVPDGSGGTAGMQVAPGAIPDQLILSWDDGCAPAANVLFGPLEQVSTYGLLGSVCGAASPATWDGVPAGNLWLLLVTDDGQGTESSWGQGPVGERHGAAASGECGTSAKNVWGTCP